MCVYKITTLCTFGGSLKKYWILFFIFLKQVFKFSACYFPLVSLLGSWLYIYNKMTKNNFLTQFKDYSVKGSQTHLAPGFSPWGSSLDYRNPCGIVLILLQHSSGIQIINTTGSYFGFSPVPIFFLAARGN